MIRERPRDCPQALNRSDHSHLVVYWRARLAANQGQEQHGSPHLRWLRRISVRVYRLLLVQHEKREGADLWRTMTAADCWEEPVLGMPLVDNAHKVLGQPPKAPGKIKTAPKAIHIANDRFDT